MSTTDTPVKKDHKMLDWKLLKRLFPYVRQHMWLLSSSVVLMILVDVTGVLSPYLVKVGIDQNDPAPGLRNTRCQVHGDGGLALTRHRAGHL